MSVGDLKQRFARLPCRQLLDRLAHAGDGAIGGMGFERRWHVVLSARSCRIPATPAASLLALADQVELPDFTASLVGSSTSGDLFICAKDLLVEADPAICGASLHRQVTSYCTNIRNWPYSVVQGNGHFLDGRSARHGLG